MAFSFPVTEAPFNPSGIAFSFSANTLTAEFLTSVTVESDSGLFLNSVALNLQSATSRTPIAVATTVDPWNAVTFAQSNTAILGLADPGACQPAAQSAFTVEDLTSACPTAMEAAAFRAAVDLRLDADPSAGTLVCRAADGSADLTRLEERTFQAFRIMQFLPFDAPPPWTPKPLYDWFTGAIRGIRYRSDIPFSYCCEPAGYIDIQTSVGVLASPTNPEAVISLADLLIHEARHNEGLPHTCGNWDQTLPELGAWGAVFYYNEWAAFHTGDFLKSKTPGRATFYGDWTWGAAQSVLTTAICDHAGGVVVSPAVSDFGAQTVGVASAPRTLAITQTEGGPVTIGGVGLEGPNASDFTVTSPPCAAVTLPPSCAAVVRFAPLTAGPRSAQLRVTFAGSGIQRTVTLHGIGAAAATCTYALSSPGQSIGGSGGFGTVSITAADGCNWQAESDAPWLSIASGRAGAGSGTLAFVASSNPGPAPRTGRLTIAGRIFIVNQPATQPAVNVASVANGASFQAGFASAAWVSLFGTNLSQTTRDWQAGDFASGMLPVALDGVAVTINGLPAYVYYVSPTQLNVLAPDDATVGAVEVQVTTAQGRSNSLTAQKQQFAPAFFWMPGGTYVAAQHADYSYAGKPGLIAGVTTQPVKPGEVILLYGTGFGSTNPAVPSAQLVTTAAVLANSVEVTIGGVPAPVGYAALVGAGLYQFNVTAPDVPDGDAPVMARIGGVQTQTGVLLTIKR